MISEILKESREVTEDPFKNLKKLAALAGDGDNLPRVTENPFRLSFAYSHNFALQIAAGVLEEVSQDVRGKNLKTIYSVFENWRDDHGVYSSGGFFSGLLLGGGTKQESAKDYCRRMSLAAALEEKEFNLPEPWTFCPFAQTALGMFNKLFGDGYPPLFDAFKNSSLDYEITLAILIFLTHNSNNDNVQSGDCIEAGLKLSHLKITGQRSIIKGLTPLAEREFQRQRQSKLKRTEKKNATQTRVLEAYQKALKTGGKFKLGQIARDCKVTESYVSKVLRAAGVAPRQKRIS